MRVYLSALAWLGVTYAAAAGSSFTTATTKSANADSIVAVGKPAPVPTFITEDDDAALAILRQSLDANGALATGKASDPGKVTSETTTSIGTRGGSIETTPMVIRGGEVGGPFSNAAAAAVGTPAQDTSHDQKTPAPDESASKEAPREVNDGSNPDLPQVEHQAEGNELKSFEGTKSGSGLNRLQ